jgi:hypothetical protein
MESDIKGSVRDNGYGHPRSPFELCIFTGQYT